MKVETMEVPGDASGMANSLTYLKVDEWLLITVQGFGTGEYRWKVQQTQPRIGWLDVGEILADSIFKRPTDDGWYTADATFGQAAVWYSHLTFAHAMMDFINNQ